MTQGASDPYEAAFADAEAAVDKVRAGASETEAAEALAEDGIEVEVSDTNGELEALEGQVEALAARLSEAENSVDDFRNKWLLARADFENFKKRQRRDMDDQKQRDAMKLLADFFPVLDNLDRALDTVKATTGGEGQIGDGLRLVRREFLGALKKHDIVPLESVGERFDPAFHEALQQVDSPDHPPGVVMFEFEKGFLRGERLLRPARVVVASPNSTGSEPSTAEGPTPAAAPAQEGQEREGEV